MVDRFGPLPEAVCDLISVVKLRRVAVLLGICYVKIKNGLMILHFVEDHKSPFYQSSLFLGMLRGVMAEPERFVVKQGNKGLAITVRKINSIAEGVGMLRSLYDKASQEVVGKESLEQQM